MNFIEEANAALQDMDLSNPDLVGSAPYARAAAILCQAAYAEDVVGEDLGQTLSLLVLLAAQTEEPRIEPAIAHIIKRSGIGPEDEAVIMKQVLLFNRGYYYENVGKPDIAEIYVAEAAQNGHPESQAVLQAIRDAGAQVTEEELKAISAPGTSGPGTPRYGM